MPRDITVNTQTEADTQFGTEPIIIVEIDWSSGTEQYGDKTFVLGSMDVQGKLMDASPAASTADISSGEFSSFDVTLGDDDGSLKTKINTVLIEGSIATVYHHFEGLLESDLVVLIKGRVYGDVVWEESERTLSFTIEQFIEDNEIGYSLDEDEITDQAQSAEGQAWPMGFGTPIHVPALRVRQAKLGTLDAFLTQDTTIFEVGSGADFPQDTPIEILIAGVKYAGTMSDTTFTSTSVNLPRYTNVAFGERIAGDVNFNDATVAWLDDPTVYIQGQYVLVNHSQFGYMVNFCTAQFGAKCTFRKEWTNDETQFASTLFRVFLDELETFEESAIFTRETWPVAYRWQGISGSPVISLVGSPNYNGFLPPADYLEVVQSVSIPLGKFQIEKGVLVKEVQDFPDLYVFNAIPSASLLQVFGTRTYDGEDRFDPIPSSYYVKNLSDSLAGQSPSTLAFAISLEERISEDWSGDVYASFVSSVGPNVSNILKFIADTYSNQLPDATSFEEVRLAVENFPAHFAIFDQPSALDFMRSVSYQARIALVLQNGDIVLRYLSEVPTADSTIDESDVQLQTLRLSASSIESVTTRIDATYKTDYSGRNLTERTFKYRNNVSQFGVKDQDIDIFIYTDLCLVKKTISFWGNRVSNIWREFNYNTFIDNMKLEVFDTVEHTVELISANHIRGEVALASQDTANASMELSGTLASKAGVSTDGEPIEDETYWTGDPAYPLDVVCVVIPCPECEESDLPVITPGAAIPDPDANPDEANPAIAVLWVTSPDTVIRGRDFAIRVELRDGNGNLISEFSSGTLTLTSSDGADVLAGVSVQFSGGVYEDVISITTGTGTDTGTLIIAPAIAGALAKVSPAFAIQDNPAFTGTCLIAPTVVQRGASFTITLAACEPLAVLDLLFTPEDANDKLYLAGTSTLADTITIDGAGASVLSVEVRGGFAAVDVSAQITPQDNSAPIATEIPIPCQSITIQGVTPITMMEEVFFEETVDVNFYYCVLEAPVSYVQGSPFEMTLTIYNFDGTVATPIDGTTLILSALDVGNGLSQLGWTSVCANTEKSGLEIVGTIEAGIWTCSSLVLDDSGAVGPIIFLSSAQVDGVITTNCEVQTILELAPYFTVAAPPLITRGVPFDLVIQAVNGTGENDLTYTPSGDVELSLLNPSDLGDTLVPLVTDNTGWVDGAKTVSMTIDDGTLPAEANIRAQQITDELDGTSDDIIIDGTATVKSETANGMFYGDSQSLRDLDYANYPTVGNAEQVTAKTNFLADASIAAFASTLETGMGVRSDGFNEYLFGAEAAYFFKYNILAGDKTDVIAVKLRINLNFEDRFDGVVGAPFFGYQPTAFPANLRVRITSHTTQPFSSGQDVADAALETVVTGDIINAKNVEAGNFPNNSSIPGTSVIELTLDPDIVSNLIGNDLYIWIYPEKIGQTPNIGVPNTMTPALTQTVTPAGNSNAQLWFTPGFTSHQEAIIGGAPQLIIYK